MWMVGFDGDGCDGLDKTELFCRRREVLESQAMVVIPGDVVICFAEVRENEGGEAGFAGE